jgi:hypothetical protein
MPAETLKCKDCGEAFILSEKEAAFFLRKGLTLPKRCAPCRAKRREERELAEQKGEHDVK